jgi:hypothetical protein
VEHHHDTPPYPVTPSPTSGHSSSIFDRIYGPEPPTPTDIQREADHERLVRAFPMTGETIEPRNAVPGKIGTAK